METYKWYVDEEAQQIDIFAIWGITGIKATISGGVLLAVGSLFVVAKVTGIVVVFGGLVVAAVVVAALVEGADSYWGITDSAIKHLREIDSVNIRDGVAGISPAGIQP